jgi:hypothetical protein
MKTIKRFLHKFLFEDFDMFTLSKVSLGTMAITLFIVQVFKLFQSVNE